LLSALARKTLFRKRTLKLKRKSRIRRGEYFEYSAVHMFKANYSAKEGLKPLPKGRPDCLSGLSFVFTGTFSAFSRQEMEKHIEGLGGQANLTKSFYFDLFYV
jgi:BRCT domain type II-containing protein